MNVEPLTSTPSRLLTHGVSINDTAYTAQAERVLSSEALPVVAALHRALESERQRLLFARRERQARWDAGALPGYLPADEHPEARGDWQVADLPDDLLTRRVEITGPVSDPKMVINMLSRTADGHRADAAMLDFEDSMKPSWANVMQGVENVIGAAEGTLHFAKRDAEGNVLKEYTLDPDDMPLLMVRVRGLHLDESNLRVDGEPVSGGLLDFALCMVHTAKTLIAKGKTPTYYVPKCEHYLEARWWNRLFSLTEEHLGLPEGTVKATFLIETLPAAFQMEEILYEYRTHAAGLNGGRWDKIFSDIKVLREHADRVMADRASIGMNRPWMSNYAKRLIKVCHKHGAFGMGGMAAFTPGRTPELRAEQTAKVVADKEFEAGIGHDGCWVSHPYFIEHALQPFLDALGGKRNQLGVDPDIEMQPDLLPEGGGPRTMDGLRTNVRVGIAYMKGWNQDIGCVAWDNLMEDLATLEISRAQTWQWLHHGITLDGGTQVTRDLVGRVFEEELDNILGEIREAMNGAASEAVGKELDRYRQAAADASLVFTEETMRPFLACVSDRVGDAEQQRRVKETGTCH
ncbi:MAG: malate synthase A [Bacteroidota bacterium]